MEELIGSVKKLVDEELQRANSENGDKFPTMHDGYGVILEEFQETQEELDRANEKLKIIWSCIRQDNESGAVQGAQLLKKRAILTACEAIQVAAMAEKFEQSFK